MAIHLFFNLNLTNMGWLPCF